jgi:hypothetical protein
MNDASQSTVRPPVKADPSAVHWLPGSHFFTERLAVPQGIKSKDLEDFILTQLDTHAPFPTEQLAFGMLVDSDRQEVFYYACLNSLLLNEDSSITESAPQLPGFFPFLSQRTEKPCIVAAINEAQLSLLVFDQAGAFPAEVHSVELPLTRPSEDFIRHAIADLLRDLPWIQLPVEGPVKTLKSTQMDWRGRLHVEWDVSVGETESQMIPLAMLSKADLRERGTKQREANRSRIASGAWWASLGCSAGLLALIPLALLSSIWATSVKQRSAQVSAQAPRVAAIESKSRNLEVFENGSAARLQPLSMLELINRKRPDSLYFTQVKAYEGCRIQVEGMTESAGTSAVNSFREAVSALPDVSHCNIEITRINQGVTYFRLSVEFKDLAVQNVGGQA